MISRNNVQESPMAHNIRCHCPSLSGAAIVVMYTRRACRDASGVVDARLKDHGRNGVGSFRED